MSLAASGTTNPLFWSKQVSGTRQTARCFWNISEPFDQIWMESWEHLQHDWTTLTESICMLILNHRIPQLMERNIWSNFGYFMQMKWTEMSGIPGPSTSIHFVAVGLQKWNLWIFLMFSKWRIQSNESIWNICYQGPPTLLPVHQINSLRITQSIKPVTISRRYGRGDIFDIFPIVCGWQ